MEISLSIGFALLRMYLFLPTSERFSRTITTILKKSNAKIGSVENAAIALTGIWRSRSTSVETKKRLLGSLVFPTATYGSECWVLRMSDKKRLESFELWCYRRPHGISWTKTVTNESVFHEINCHMGLLDSINTRQLAFVGHTLRPDCLEKTLLMGWYLEAEVEED